MNILKGNEYTSQFPGVHLTPKFNCRLFEYCSHLVQSSSGEKILQGWYAWNN